MNVKNIYKNVFTLIRINKFYRSDPDPMEKVPDPDVQKSTDPTGSGSGSSSLHAVICKNNREAIF